MPVAVRPMFSLWKRLSALPGGRFVFSRLLNQTVPYSGSIAANIQMLEPGHAIASMDDRRSVRNHVSQVHAAAVMNLAETVSGLAVTSLLPAGSDSVVQRASIEYRKRARGPLTAECKVERGAFDRDGSQSTEVLVRDRRRNIVAEAQIFWGIKVAAAA